MGGWAKEMEELVSQVKRTVAMDEEKESGFGGEVKVERTQRAEDVLPLSNLSAQRSTRQTTSSSSRGCLNSKASYDILPEINNLFQLS